MPCNIQTESKFNSKNRILENPCDKFCNLECKGMKTDDLDFMSLTKEIFEKIDKGNYQASYNISGNFLFRNFEINLSISLDNILGEALKNFVVFFNRKFISESELIRKFRIRLFREITNKFRNLGQIEVDPTHWTQLGDPDQIRINGSRFLITARTHFRITSFKFSNLITNNLAVPGRLK